MSVTEIAKLCESLPPAKRDEVADFARFLLFREQDARWEDILDNPSPRPHLEAFLRDSASEEHEPLDLRRL
jgi:hypothetical protein